MIGLKSRYGLVMIAGVLLSACHKGADGNAPAVDLFGSRSSKPEAKFGTAFEKSYHADSNAQPVNVSAGDLPPRDPHAEPVPVN